MRVHIETGAGFYMRGTVGIYIFERGPTETGSGRIMRLNPSEDFGARVKWEELALHAELPEPTLELPTEAFEMLVAAGSDHLPPSSATDRHLYDAIGVRDRLLALVEQAHAPNLEPPTLLQGTRKP